MKTISNIIIGKATVSGSTLKVDGKKYPVTEKFAGIMKKLDLNGQTAAFLLDKDGNIMSVQLNGTYNVRGVEVPRQNGEGTFRANYLIIVGTACNLKEGKPFRFSMATRDEKGESVFYECKAWEDLAERAATELAVPDGERKPKAWVVARIGTYNDRPQYTAEDFGVIPMT